MRPSAIVAAAVFVCATAASAAHVVELSTWGAPGDARFDVVVDSSGTLTVTRESFPRTDEGLTKKTVTKHLSRAQLQKVIKLATDATDFAAGCRAVADGTSASLLVVHDGKETKRSCHNADVWPNGKKSRALLNAINRIVPGEMRVY